MQVEEQAIIQVTFRNRLGVLTSPTTVIGAVTLPDGTTSPALNFAEVSTGIWEAPYLCTIDGDHWARAEGSGALLAVVQKKFHVAKKMVAV